MAPTAESLQAPEATGSSRARRRRPWLRIVAWVGVVTLLLGALALAGPALWVDRQSDGRIYSTPDAPARDVVLVLGAGLEQNTTPTPFLSARLDRAVELWQQHKARVVMVSGDNRRNDYDEPTSMAIYLVSHGVPADKVVKDFAGRDTYDSCSRARRIFGVDRLTLVSQGYHLPRAVAVCRGVGVDAIGVGDWTMDQGYYRPTWESGERREVVAKLKAALDVVSGRDPVLGRPESGVHDALRTP